MLAICQLAFTSTVNAAQAYIIFQQGKFGDPTCCDSIWHGLPHDRPFFFSPFSSLFSSSSFLDRTSQVRDGTSHRTHVHFGISFLFPTLAQNKNEVRNGCLLRKPRDPSKILQGEMETKSCMKWAMLWVNFHGLSKICCPCSII